MPRFFSQEVEDFYSTGIKSKHLKIDDIERADRGFLNFGLWEKETNSYREAATNLLDFFIDNSGIREGSRILNAACGYGTETFEFHRRLKPQYIEGIDITGIHTEFANRKAHALGLAQQIGFYKKDCCHTDYPSEHFSCIAAIEGPAHFYTKERFFKEAYRILEDGGTLVLTDIILGRNFDRGKKFQVAIMKFTARCWKLPSPNWIDEKGYRELLKDSGFRLLSFKKIGEKVFPGYAENCFKLKTTKIRIFHRGLWAVLGMNSISWFLGYLQKKRADRIYLCESRSN